MSAQSETTRVADAVRTLLLGGELGEGVRVERRWTPVLVTGRNGPEVLVPEDLTVDELLVTVTPVARKQKRLARRKRQRDHTIEVCVARRIAGDADSDAVDAVAELVEALVFDTERLPTLDAAALLEADNQALFVREHLEDSSVFVAIVHATYRLMD